MNNVFEVRKTKMRKLTVIGLLSGITMFLGLSGYGFIQLPVARLTIMHIPVIIGTILEGPKVGMAIGFMFGAFSVFQNAIAPNLLSFALINPLVSILPRILIALTTYVVYKAVRIKNQSIRVSIAALVGSITNTVGVLAMILLLYVDKYAEVQNTTVEGAKKLVLSVVYTNGILEAIVAAIITSSIVLAVKKMRK
ncbi:ECF transporter S component [Clostridium sp.]|uniref:ECF transporter S component n=1 Tax=Clostridium sp. TaxID=1506 RepID=UPI003463B91D